jgi:hypothetical protein
MVDGIPLGKTARGTFVIGYEGSIVKALGLSKAFGKGLALELILHNVSERKCAKAQARQWTSSLVQ